MARQCRLNAVGGLLFLVAVSGVLAGPGRAADVDPGAVLVQKALACEVAGDHAQRQTLLEQCVQQMPESAPAHWHLGEVFLEGAWRTPEEAQRMACRDTHLEQYRQLREETPLTAEGQAALARWCRKNHLDEEQRIHWIGVLRDQPNDPEALQALNRLGLRPYQGRLRSQAEIAQLKARVQETEKAQDAWRPLVNEWRDAAARVDGTPPSSLREKIPQIASMVQMQALNQCVWLSVGSNHSGETYHRMLQELVEYLSHNPYPAGAEALVRYAVNSEFEDVRTAAIAGLKRHPYDHYVPRLLATLRGELESSLQFGLTADGRLIAHETRFQAGGLSDAQGALDLSVSGRNRPVALDASPQAQAVMAQVKQDRLWKSQRRAAQVAEAHRAAVEQTNQEIAARNSRVAAALRETTGQDFDSTITAWWDWWQNHNGQTGPSDRQKQQATPEEVRQSRWVATYADAGVQEQTWRDQSSAASVNASYTSHSCFAPGTTVWTLTGLVPIETIRMGDRVLAQDPESGELAYKPVLAVTVQEDGPRTQIAIGGETLLATGSHPFWVTGQGWRLAKELQPADRLHTVSGSAAVASVQSVTAAEAKYTKAHNLILPEFHTFFVGSQGILVHDNTMRAPTANLLPGLPPQAEEGQDVACP